METESTEKKKTFNKGDLVSHLFKMSAHNLLKDACIDAVEMVLEAITDSLKRGETIQVIGLGTFQVIMRKAGVTGFSKKPYPAKKAVKFKPAKAIIDALNKGWTKETPAKFIYIKSIKKRTPFSRNAGFLLTT